MTSKGSPNQGDDDRFSHFVRLIDPDLFPEPTRVGERASEIRREILSLGENCPWALRRLKEDLRDIQGQRLFPDRHAHTVKFRLNQEEFDLYKAVTAYGLCSQDLQAQTQSSRAKPPQLSIVPLSSHRSSRETSTGCPTACLNAESRTQPRQSHTSGGVLYPVRLSSNGRCPRFRVPLWSGV